MLVPASGYYEWETIAVPGEKKPRKQPFYITRKDGFPFTFAGLWEKWKDGMLSFTILTTDAGATTGDLHDRMPVILDEASIPLWTERGEVTMPTDLDDLVQLDLRFLLLSLQQQRLGVMHTRVEAVGA